MLNNRLDEEIRLYYADLRNEAEEDALSRKEALWAAHPELAEVESALAAEGFGRLRAALDSPSEQAEQASAFEALSNRRAQILQDLGLPEDYAPPVYRCATCHDFGQLQTKVCPACYPQALAAIAYTQPEDDFLSDASFSQFNLDLFEDATHFNDSPKRRMQALKTRMEAYVEDFSQLGQTNERFNLFFSGITGTGKTYLALCIARALREAGFSVMIQSAPQLLRAFSEYRVLSKSFSPNPERMEQMAGINRQITHADFLVIDDLGTEAMDAHSAGDFLSLLNERARKHRPILITSNLDLRQLKERYEERIYSRIAGTFQAFAFIGDDLRVKKRKN